MRPHYLMTTLSLAAMLGVLLASNVGWPIILWLSATLTLLVLFYIPLYRVALLFAIFGLVIGSLRYYQAEAVVQNNVPIAEVGQTAEIEGTVLKAEPLGSAQTQLIVRLDNDRKITIKAWGDIPAAPGDLIRAAIRRDLDPEHMGWLRKDGLNAVYQMVTLHSQTSPATGSLLRTLFYIRETIAERITNFLPEPASQLINGLLLGLRADMSQELRDQLKRSGTTHIVALSGTNITLILFFLVNVLVALPRRVRFVAAGVAVLAFIIMTGLSSSVVRAAAMGWLFLLGNIWGRKAHLGVALTIAAAAMVLLNPFILQYDIGFQLSALATAGLIFITPILQRWLNRWPRLKLLTDITCVTLAATIATLPLLVFHFGTLSTISLISNVVIVPVVPIAMATGLFGLILSFIGQWVQPLAFIAWWPSHFIVEAVRFFGNLPGASIDLPPIPAFLPMIWYLLMGVSIYVLHLHPAIDHDSSDRR